ncbi:MAG: Sensory box histidine kinase/response regulator [Candidatus Ozemobacter sibiricus]|uniref:histidine kinase n=1 Tax=Candidatus Ozemobacter sibiricus TaxID=2268124 RepID=A0A367ZU46_9BACT|nr:MAG: Sensory box histidine kinase/response regulator [Candidatus Ozemobacter sibiricus]
MLCGLLMVAGLWYSRLQTDLRRHEAYASLLAIAQLKKDQIMEWRRARLSDARLVQANAWLAERVARLLEVDDPTADAEIRAYLRHLQGASPYANSLVVDAAGTVRLSLASPPGTISPETMSALALALADGLPRPVDLYRQGSPPTSHLDFIAPVLISHGTRRRAVGAVVLQCEAADSLYPLIRTWPTPSLTAETLLVRRDGDAALFLNDLRHRADTALQLRIPLTRLEIPGVQGVLGTIGCFEGRDDRDVAVLSVLTPIPDTPWVMVTKIDADEAFAPLRQERYLLGGLYGPLVLGFIGVLYLGWQRQRSVWQQALLEQTQARQHAEAQCRATAALAADQSRVKEELAASEALYGSLFRNMLNGFAYCRMLFSPEGAPEDFVFVSVNESFARQTGLPDVVGKKASEVMSNFRKKDPALLEIVGEVAKTGRPWAGEVPLQSLDMWLHLSVYCPRPDHFVAIFDVITERQQAEMALTASEETFRQLVEGLRSEYFFFRHGPDGVLTYLSPSFTSVLGYSLEEAMVHYSTFFTPNPVNQAAERFNRLSLQGIQQPAYEIEVFHKNGDIRRIEVSESPVFDGQGRVVAVEGFARDMTARHRLEAEKEKLQAHLQQAAKLEAIGRLAGGIAHDFNNMLGVILGYAELLLAPLDTKHPHYQGLQAIFQAARRSADLTRQLLGFARKQPISPRRLDLNEVVAEALPRLRRLLGDQIECAWVPWSDPCFVCLDPTQIEHVLVSLITNARDAIAGPGKIALATRPVRFDQATRENHEEFASGDFVQLSVSDTGRGMDQATQDRLFEPFFTTKGLGRATGMGLAMVYGIMRQNRGFIKVVSDPGAGSTFHLYFPAAIASADRPAAAAPAAPLESRGETILVVEDEPGLLAMIRGMLDQLGYQVLATDQPGQAMTIATAHRGPIQLLLTDVVLPELNGRALAATFTARFPGLKVLFMSGSSEEVIAQAGVLPSGVAFLQKPFTIHQLAQALRTLLDR